MRKRGEQRDRGDEEPDRRAARPAPVVAAQQREHEREEPAGEEDEAEQVEAAVLLVARLVEVTRTRRATQRTPIGRLTKKIQRQPAYSVRTPPTSGPIATARPTVAPQMPKAVPRSRPWNSCERIASETANMIAPPSPGAPRARFEEERASSPRRRAAEAAVKRTTPAMKTRLRPSRSPSVPAFSMQRGEHQGVGVDDPLELRKGGVQVLLNVRESDVDDRDVQKEHEDRHADDDEGPPFPFHAPEIT